MKIYGNLQWVQHPYDALREGFESVERTEKSKFEHKVMQDIEDEESWELRERCLGMFGSRIFTIPADGMESLFYGAIWSTVHDRFYDRMYERVNEWYDAAHEYERIMTVWRPNEYQTKRRIELKLIKRGYLSFNKKWNKNLCFIERNHDIIDVGNCPCCYSAWRGASHPNCPNCEESEPQCGTTWFLTEDGNYVINPFVIEILFNEHEEWESLTANNIEINKTLKDFNIIQRFDFYEQEFTKEYVREDLRENRKPAYNFL